MKKEDLNFKRQKLIKQLADIDKKIKELKDKEQEVEWLFIPELKIEIQTKIHHKGKSYNNLIDEFGKEYLEEHLPTYAQLQWLRNSKYCNQLGLIDTWEFAKQEDEISKKNDYVAWFIALSDRAYFGCNGDPQYSDASLGVRFARSITPKQCKKIFKKGSKLC